MGDIFRKYDPAVQDGGFKAIVHPEIRKLIERGNITPAEVAELRCNSWEWEALVPALNDEAFVEHMQHALDNCFTTRERPFTTYNQAIEGLYAPDLLRRFAVAARAARDYAETIDNVREALGQKSTHYLIIADDVKELVDAVESHRDALSVLKRIQRNNVPGDSEDRFLRTPTGFINNCSLANFEEEKNCQICLGQCPDRARFEVP